MAMLSQADALDGESIYQAGRASEAAARAASEAARAEAVGSQRVQLLPLGDVARQINGTNELWLAIVLTSPELQVDPPFLTCLTLNHRMKSTGLSASLSSSAIRVSVMNNKHAMQYICAIACTLRLYLSRRVTTTA